MLINPTHVQQLIDILRERYPRWAGFADEQFGADDLAAKQELVWKARELLNEAVLRRLMKEQRFDEIVHRLEFVGKENSLTHRNTLRPADLGILHEKRVNKQTFCYMIFDLLYGSGRTPDRLQRFSDYLVNRRLRGGWAFPTFFLHLCHPATEFFVKPAATKWFLEWIGAPFALTASPTADGYRNLMTLVHELEFQLSDQKPRDLVDVQTALWTAFCLRSGEPVTTDDNTDGPHEGRGYWVFTGEPGSVHFGRDGQPGYVALGTREVGDVARMNRADFDGETEFFPFQNSEVGFPAETLWRFARHPKEGDRLVLVDESGHAAGLGTIAGGYYHAAGSAQAHRLPVTWQDLKVRRWTEIAKKPFDRIDAAAFERVSNAAPIEGENARVLSLFRPGAFDLLAELNAEPTPDFYERRKADFAELIERPFGILFRELAASLPPDLQSRLETDRGLFCAVQRGDEEKGETWDSYWGAFYLKGMRRAASPKLFVLMEREHIEFGLDVGWFAGPSRERFFRNGARNVAGVAAVVEKWRATARTNGDPASVRFLTIDSPSVEMPSSAKAKDWKDVAPYFSEERDAVLRIAAWVGRDRVESATVAELGAMIGRAFAAAAPLLELTLAPEPIGSASKAASPALPPTPAPVSERPIEPASDASASSDQTSKSSLESLMATLVKTVRSDMETLKGLRRPVESPPIAPDVEPEIPVGAVPKSPAAPMAPAMPMSPAEMPPPFPITEAAAIVEPLAPGVPDVAPIASSPFEATHPSIAPEDLPPAPPETPIAPASAITEIVLPTTGAVSLEPEAAAPLLERPTALDAAVASAVPATVSAPMDEPSPVHPAYSLADISRESAIDVDVLESWTRAIERKGQAVFYGPPGTGKTFMADKLARHLVGGGDGFRQVLQFHSSYTYDDFILGRRSRRSVDGDGETTAGRFSEFCRAARTRRGRCVLVLDEIHRVDLAKVMGELLFLLENRGQELRLVGGQWLQVPENVRIIATMNTAGGALERMDPALRRRFAFLELPPLFSVLERFHARTGFPVEKLVDVLVAINAAIGNKNEHLGIAYFLREDLTDQIADIWRMEIEPQLEGAFPRDPEKVNLFRWERVKPRLVAGRL